MQESRTVNLLGITFDKELKLDEHLNSVCLKANRKLSALSKIKTSLDFNKMRVSSRPFLKYKFKCCPLTQMLYSRNTNNGINHL